MSGAIAMAPGDGSDALPEVAAWIGRGLPTPVADDNALGLVQAALDALRAGNRSALVVVLEAEGSTYVSRGAMALFGESRQAGWLSGGCLEPEIARRARASVESGSIGWLEIDTREDAALLAGSTPGCRGRLRLALLPLPALPALATVLEGWLAGQQALSLCVTRDGVVSVHTPTLARHWRLPVDPPDWASARHAWMLEIARPPEAILLGMGPETPLLASLLGQLGWRLRIAESRPRWRETALARWQVIDATPSRAVDAYPHVDAALVMHHDFERDREALAALAASAAPFVGLLGPVRRQQDLFKLLRPAQCQALLPRLHSPIGIDLGGRGPEAIALSVAAQLQAWRHAALARA